jgi:hypothetical protein
MQDTLVPSQINIKKKSVKNISSSLIHRPFLSTTTTIVTQSKESDKTKTLLAQSSRVGCMHVRVSKNRVSDVMALIGVDRIFC